MRARILIVAGSLTAWACSDAVAPESPGTFSAVAAGFEHTCGLTQDGEAYCWGRNSESELGAALTDPQYRVPQRVSTLLRFIQIDAGYFHSCGLATDGAAYCWGKNFVGALGVDTAADSDAPIPVDGGLRFKAIALGYLHTCGLTEAGVAYCWGDNTYKQLGRDTAATSARTPVAVAGGHTFSTLSAGSNFTCGIESDGAAYCWGWNVAGMLGSGDTALAIPIPVAVAGGLKFKAIAGGTLHACGVATNGELYCWGMSDWGVLGIGPSIGDHRTPERVVTDRRYTAVSLGATHSCALDLDGALACWGLNDTGQLAATTHGKCIVGSGPDYIPCTLAPIAAAPRHYFHTLTAGEQHTCAVGFDGAAFCWGKNNEGQIGSGSLEQTTAAPARVPDPTTP